MNIGVTGHQRLRGGSWDWVRHEIAKYLTGVPRPLVGVSSLAVGADQEFARVVLEQHGELYIVVPFEGYDLTLDPGADRVRYSEYLRHATTVEVLDRLEGDEASYMNAGRRVVDLSEAIVAVWDGKPVGGLGGTADVVDYALAKRRSVLRLDPGAKVVQRL